MAAWWTGLSKDGCGSGVHTHFWSGRAVKRGKQEGRMFGSATQDPDGRTASQELTRMGFLHASGAAQRLR
jgi:hypothetical protein